MKLLPSIVALKIHGNKNFSLWLPLFLIWPFLLILGLIVFPMIFILFAIIFKGNLKRAILFFPYSYNFFADLKGTHIEVKKPDQNILISIK